MLKTFFIRLVSLAAAILSLLMLPWNGKQLYEVFRLTDPMGLFGSIFSVTGFLANVCIVFLFSVLVWRNIKTGGFLNKVPVLFVLVFSLKIFEALSLSSCLFGQFEKLCGAPSVMVSYITAPLVLAVTVNFIFRTEDRGVRWAGLILAAILAAAGAVTWWLITPKSHAECLLYSQIRARAACVERFALSSLDTGICHQIDFRQKQYECIGNIALRTRRPNLCEEIQTPPKARVSKYEVNASDVRDICYFRLAFDLPNRDLCLKIEAEDKKKTCLDKSAPKPADKR